MLMQRITAGTDAAGSSRGRVLSLRTQLVLSVADGSEATLPLVVEYRVARSAASIAFDEPAGDLIEIVAAHCPTDDGCVERPLPAWQLDLLREDEVLMLALSADADGPAR